MALTAMQKAPFPFPFFSIERNSECTYAYSWPVTFRPKRFFLNYDIAEKLIVDNIIVGNIMTLMEPMKGVYFSDTVKPKHWPVKMDFPTVTPYNKIQVRLRNIYNCKVEVFMYFRGVYVPNDNY